MQEGYPKIIDIEFFVSKIKCMKCLNLAASSLFQVFIKFLSVQRRNQY